MSLDILIVRYRSESVEGQCLQTLAKFTHGPYRLINFDNNAARLSLTKIWDNFIRESTSEYVALINPDVFFGPEWDEKCLSAMRRDPTIVACTPAATGDVATKHQKINVQLPKNITDDMLIRLSKRQAVEEKNVFINDPKLNAYVYLLNRKAYLEIGGFDVEAFPFYWQETDLNFRLVKAGYKVGCVRDSYVHHVGRVSTLEAQKHDHFDASGQFQTGLTHMQRKYPGWGHGHQNIRVLITMPHYYKGDPSRSRMLNVLTTKYLNMPYKTHLAVHTNVRLHIHPKVEVITSTSVNPMHLPFSTRKTILERLDEFDLFIYTENDILITKENIEAFLNISPVLGKNRVCGFMRFELDHRRLRYYTDVHGGWKWDPKSVIKIGKYVFAKFANLHQGCFVLTNEQMRLAISSGGFLTPPHKNGQYGLLESAATDVYSQCRLSKYLCISNLNDFLVHHMPNNYVGKNGWWGGPHTTSAVDFERGVSEMLKKASRIPAFHGSAT